MEHATKTQNTRLVDLTFISGVMLIVEHPSGVLYQNQVGGISCAIERMEGVLIPLDVASQVMGDIINQPYKKAGQGIPPQVAGNVEALLARERGSNHIVLDKSMLHSSWEAWIHVLIDTPDAQGPILVGGYAGNLFGFGLARGVLTWINSD